ncbi:MAG: FHA domain-containing protein [Fimbriimonas sp.]|nr:FHA domain-containing protein [Fimbriimonas sp.]
MRILKVILLPILGLLAAIVAFKLAQPYEATLAWDGLSREDPRTHFTYGTMWGEINRIAFGALICGPFCIALSIGRRSIPRVVMVGAFGAVLGGIFNFVTDSSADLIGLATSGQSEELGSLLAMLAWCTLVPLGIAFAITLALGLNAERVRRAIFAVKWAIVASFCVQMAGGTMSAVDPSASNAMQSQIPVWRMMEIAIGVALGLTILVADEWVRLASIRLMHGRNEFRDWSLDYPVNRIGSAEGCEIPLFGVSGVEPIHAVIVRSASRFHIEAKTNTLVNGQPVSHAPLQSGDTISIGGAQLVFTTGGGFYRTVPVGQPASSIPSSAPIVQGPIVAPQGQLLTTPYVPLAAQPIATPFSPQPPQPVQPVPGMMIAQPSQQAQPLYVSPQQHARVLVDAYGQPVHMPVGRYTVGRENTNAICLYNDPYVAPHHADFVSSAQGLEVVDLGTPGGSKINGVRFSGSSPLKPGDVIEFGSTQFTVYQ